MHATAEPVATAHVITRKTRVLALLGMATTWFVAVEVLLAGLFPLLIRVWPALLFAGFTLGGLLLAAFIGFLIGRRAGGLFWWEGAIAAGAGVVIGGLIGETVGQILLGGRAGLFIGPTAGMVSMFSGMSVGSLVEVGLAAGGAYLGGRASEGQNPRVASTGWRRMGIAALVAPVAIVLLGFGSAAFMLFGLG